MPATRSGSARFGKLILSLVLILSLFAFPVARPAYSQFGKDFGLGGIGELAGDQEKVTASAVIVPAKDDQPAILVVTADMLDGHWIYSITQKPGGPKPTTITIDALPDVKIGDFKSIQEPTNAVENFGTDINTEKHIGSVTWYAPILISDGKTIDEIELKGKVRSQVCKIGTCFPPKNFNFTAKAGASPIDLPIVDSDFSDDAAPPLPSSAPPVPLDIASEGDGAPLSNEPVAAALGFDIEQVSPRAKAGAASDSFLFMMGAAVLAGFILNFMPCVLPVIGLKLLSFLEQGGSNPRRVLALNLWYSLGIISVFWVLAAISVGLQSGLGQFFGFEQQSFGWGQQFRYDAFNITLVSIVFVMALSFLGVWEIPIPGFAGGRNAQGLAQKEGAIGAYSKGIITTLLATPCSGPFLGTAVGFALRSTPAITFLIFTLMGLGMAAPYILVGFKPSLMRFLPKPGAWMDTFKQVMGFVLIGTVLWLLRPIGKELLMPTLILLASLAAACWWIGRTPVYASRGEKAKSWIYGMLFVGLAGWLSFATPQVTDPLPWKSFRMADFVNDLNDDRTVLVEFTAEWCATCKALKLANLDRTKTKEAVTKNNVIVYEVDIDHITDEEMTFFTKLQPSGGVPLVAVFDPSKKYEPICFGDGYTQSQILDAIKQASRPADLRASH